MQDVFGMKLIKTIEKVNKYFPDLYLRHERAQFLLLLDLLKEVAFICVLHGYA